MNGTSAAVFSSKDDYVLFHVRNKRLRRQDVHSQRVMVVSCTVLEYSLD